MPRKVIVKETQEVPLDLKAAVWTLIPFISIMEIRRAIDFNWVGHKFSDIEIANLSLYDGKISVEPDVGFLCAHYRLPGIGEVEVCADETLDFVLEDGIVIEAEEEHKIAADVRRLLSENDADVFMKAQRKYIASRVWQNVDGMTPNEAMDFLLTVKVQ